MTGVLCGQSRLFNKPNLCFSFTTLLIEVGTLEYFALSWLTSHGDAQVLLFNQVYRMDHCKNLISHRYVCHHDLNLVQILHSLWRVLFVARTRTEMRLVG